VPLGAALFPYTTLFRSYIADVLARRRGSVVSARRNEENRNDEIERLLGIGLGGELRDAHSSAKRANGRSLSLAGGSGGRTGAGRSEEHTSELQSRENLV